MVSVCRSLSVFYYKYPVVAIVRPQTCLLYSPANPPCFPSHPLSKIGCQSLVTTRELPLTHFEPLSEPLTHVESPCSRRNLTGVMPAKDPQEDLPPREPEYTFPGADEEGIPVDGVRDEGALSLVTLCAKTGASIDDYASRHRSHS